MKNETLAKSTLRVMKRNDVLTEVAKLAGWSSWSEYQTAVIHGKVDIESKPSGETYNPPIGSWIEIGRVDAVYNDSRA